MKYVFSILLFTLSGLFAQGNCGDRIQYIVENDNFGLEIYCCDLKSKREIYTFYIVDKKKPILYRYVLDYFDSDAQYPFDIEKIMSHKPENIYRNFTD